MENGNKKKVHLYIELFYKLSVVLPIYFILLILCNLKILNILM